MSRSDLKSNRIGEHFTTKEELGGYEIIIVDYRDANNILVQFQDKYKEIVPTTYRDCKKGSVINPYHPSVYGVGYIGVGKYCDNKEISIEWRDMLRRGYDKELKLREPTYKDVFVNKEFHCLQNYGFWREQNYYEIEGEQMCLDKDILIKGNKEYAPDKCIFVPKRINNLFINSKTVRGNYPIGVHHDKRYNKYIARCNTSNDRKYLGCYNTPEEAFLAYKEFKEAYIKEVADEYKGCIPDRLYKAMYAWTVEEDD